MKRLLAISLAAASLAASAQTYPGSRPISIVVPFAAGGPTDLDNLLLLCPRHHTWVHEGGISTPLIAHWPAGILNYFEGRQTSGFVEGLNNKLKLITRRCYGLDDSIALFQRLWLDIEGARLWT